MRQLCTALVLGSLAALPGCADQGIVKEEGSTVTYSYNAASDYDQVVRKADEYCEDKYGGEPGYSGNAEVIGQSEEEGAYQLTFVCK
jgi:hypothetical protein